MKVCGVCRDHPREELFESIPCAGTGRSDRPPVERTQRAQLPEGSAQSVALVTGAPDSGPPEPESACQRLDSKEESCPGRVFRPTSSRAGLTRSPHASRRRWGQLTEHGQQACAHLHLQVCAGEPKNRMLTLACTNRATTRHAVQMTARNDRCKKLALKRSFMQTRRVGHEESRNSGLCAGATTSRRPTSSSSPS